uniref:tRNA 5-methoxyuridine(34)/uridine 5-oxyacetic acid(34) synthase CmoB n=1 Tax=Ningiella ruwaisensis TaxID=2364274 RepID=UPI0010A0331B|nr:tRNA 5-methoxyuridine(34)/uridine 5-oxyacetic acid(34) synthase CmoB [Ningiella ruwaisensis]
MTIKNVPLQNWKSQFYSSIIDSPLEAFLGDFFALINEWDGSKLHAEAKKWEKQVSALPGPEFGNLRIDDTLYIESTSVSENDKKRITSILKQFMPWRKGPFSFFDIFIDTEWRSDWKWQRVSPHVGNLSNQRVLDVGCGSGYHLFRMLEQGASQVIGIDPTLLFFYQFHCVKRYAQELNVHYLPIGIEDMPETHGFDTVFSMGVLYHRLDPLAFLKQLKSQIAKNGHLVLETLVVEGDENTVLLPTERYAQMRNVYFLPSIPAMLRWLDKLGFKNARLVDDCITSCEEQRSTEWMTNMSLSDFLDPTDASKTIEGYSAPRRATFIAQVSR